MPGESDNMHFQSNIMPNGWPLLWLINIHIRWRRWNSLTRPTSKEHISFQRSRLLLKLSMYLKWELFYTFTQRSSSHPTVHAFDSIRNCYIYQYQNKSTDLDKKIQGTYSMLSTLSVDYMHETIREQI